MVLEKLKWAIRIFRSRTFVILTDKESVVSIPLMNPESFENSFLLGAQTASLVEFQSRLEELIGEHEQAIQLLAHRQGNKQTIKKKAQVAEGSGNTVRKARVKRSKKV